MRWLAGISFSFSFAIFISQYLPVGGLPLEGLPLYAGIGALALFLILLPVKHERARLAKLITYGMALGFLWNFGFDRIYRAPAQALDQVTDSYVVRVKSFPRKTDYGYSFDGSIKIDGRPDIKSVIYLSDEDNASLTPGDLISIEAKAAVPVKRNDGEYYSPRGYFLILYARSSLKSSPRSSLKSSPMDSPMDSPRENPIIMGTSSSVLYFPAKLSRLISKTAETIFTDDVSPFMKALLTGDRSQLNRDSMLLSALATTGTSHTVAVSGMHLVFLVGMIRFLIGKNKKTAFICIPVILFYMAMVGNTPSIMRAGIMQIMLLSAPLLMRDYDRLTALGFSLMVLLIINPFSARHAGLQLSFASVLGILLFSEKLRSYIAEFISARSSLKGILHRRPVKQLTAFILSPLSVTLSAMVFVLPLTAVNFGQVSMIAPIANLLVIPALSFAFSAGVIMATVGLISPQLGSLLSIIVEIPVRYIIWITKLLDRLPFSALYSRNVYINGWIVYFCALIIVIIVSRKLKRKPLWLAVPALLMLAVSMGAGYIQASNSALTVTALDVGQGQSIVLVSEGRIAAVDCGGNRMKNAGDNAAEYIISLGKRRLDYLILTHFHEDHANGALQLMGRTQVDNLVIPDIADTSRLKDEILEFAEDSGINIIKIKDEIRDFQLGAAHISLYPPIGSYDSNELGLCVMGSAGGFDMLITGDIDQETEYRLLEYTDIQELELLVVGHHGSKYSTSPELLDAANPDIAIISVGYNSYGHPTQEVLSSLYGRGTVVYRTDLCGEISIKLS